jgi:IS1 family transposase
MNRLSREKRTAVVRALVEGCSIRSVVRMTGVAKNTVTKLLGDMGCACSAYQNQRFRGLKCQRLQCDEIWSFCYAKQKNVPEEKQGQFGVGDVWTWTAIDADTKLMPTWMVGGRDAHYAFLFMRDLAGRVAHRVQLTTDGHKVYLTAVPAAFGRKIDYAQLVKLYGAERPGEARYSPPKCLGCTARKRIGDPDPAHISTSYAERANLTIRMQNRRFTRLTNAFSKKIENHNHALALHFAHYNLCRPHMSLGGKTPAMAAGVEDHAWSIEELVGLLEMAESN